MALFHRQAEASLRQELDIAAMGGDVRNVTFPSYVFYVYGLIIPEASDITHLPLRGVQLGFVILL